MDPDPDSDPDPQHCLEEKALNYTLKMEPTGTERVIASQVPVVKLRVIRKIRKTYFLTAMIPFGMCYPKATTKKQA